MTETTERSSTNRVSLKISLTPEQKFKLGEVAREHHNGNRSALIRSAVYLYERVMERPDDLPAPTQIKATLEELQTDVEQLDSTIENLPEEMWQPLPANRGGTDDEQEERDSQMPDLGSPTSIPDEVTSSITRKLGESAPESCSIDQLSEVTGLTDSELRPVLEELVTDGIVAEQNSEDGDTRYFLETEDSFGVAL